MSVNCGVRPGVGHGILLGAANVFFIALGLGFMLDGEGPLAPATWVVIFGLVPGVAAGAALGWLARGLRAHPIWLRLTALIVPALLVLLALASEFDMTRFVLVACIPTVVAALILERLTRKRTPPPLPIALARRA